MISHSEELRYRYCSEPIENIENYEEAVNDKEHMWECHHRAEILPCGRFTRAQLKKHGLYWHRPASELIFLRHDVHSSLHLKGKSRSEETKRKISESYPRKKKVEMTRLSDGYTMTFPSQQEAARWLKKNGYPKADRAHISDCCRGTRYSAYDSTWGYI